MKLPQNSYQNFTITESLKHLYMYCGFFNVHQELIFMNFIFKKITKQMILEVKIGATFALKDLGPVSTNYMFSQNCMLHENSSPKIIIKPHNL